MIDIHAKVNDIISTRDGLYNAKIVSTRYRVVDELSGLIYGTAFRNDVSMNDVNEYLNIVKEHSFKKFICDGKARFVHDFIDPKLFTNPMYHLMEGSLMKFKPGSIQAGVAEFFMSWYDCFSTLGIDNTIHGDIKIQGMDIEMKGLNSQKTADPEKMDNYIETCDGIMVVKPYDPFNKKTGKLIKSQTRSIFAIEKFNWRDSFYFEGEKLSLIDQTNVLAELQKQYKAQHWANNC